MSGSYREMSSATLAKHAQRGYREAVAFAHAREYSEVDWCVRHVVRVATRAIVQPDRNEK